jgi:RNA-directed DNA polymerase
VKAFLKAGILGQDGTLRDSNTGVPQGGILSPVLANLALSVLDESIAQIPGGPGSTQGQRAVRRHRGQGNYRLVRYADDWLLMVSGTREHAQQMREHAAAVLAPMGLRLSAEKTKITHIDEGLDFLGWHIQRHRKRGTDRQYIYTYPSRKAIKAVTAKVKTICRRNVNQPLQILIRQLNPALRGWCAYFRPGVSAAAFADLARYTQDRFWRWARRKHRRITVKAIRRRYCNGGWWPATTEIGLFNPAKVGTTRYRYRGAAIPAPWPASG